jgi:hypothetical protein
LLATRGSANYTVIEKMILPDPAVRDLNAASDIDHIAVMNLCPKYEPLDLPGIAPAG